MTRRVFRLDEVLLRSENWIALRPDEFYREVTVKLWGKGAVERRRVRGSEIAAKSRLSVREGELILSRIDARNGAIAVIPRELDGAIVSNDFPCFSVLPDRIDVHFLGWLTRTQWFVNACHAASEGTTNRVRLKDELFQRIEIPVPRLEVQRRIVAQIEAAAKSVKRAQALRRQTAVEAGLLLFAGCEVALQQSEGTLAGTPLHELVDQERGISYGIVQTGSTFDGGIPTLRAGDLRWFFVNTAGIKLVSPIVAGRYKRTALRGGELLLRIRGGVGALAVCPSEMAGGNVSREIAVIPLIASVEPHFAMYLLAAPSSQARVAGKVRGTSYVGINLEDVRNLKLPLLSRPDQNLIVARLDALQAKVGALRAFQERTTAVLDALLPSILDNAFRGEF